MKVLNFNSKVFEDYLQNNLSDFANEMDDVLVIGIREGGMPLAEIVTDFFKGNHINVEINSVICKRPSTLQKKKSQKRENELKFLFKLTPRFILDLIRNIEHYYLMKKNTTAERNLILDDKIEFDRFSKILIVDDAVDSGSTLKEVDYYIKNICRKNSSIQSLSVVVTNKETCFWPDYYLYSDVLIRFPWSLDG